MREINQKCWPYHLRCCCLEITWRMKATSAERLPKSMRTELPCVHLISWTELRMTTRSSLWTFACPKEKTQTINRMHRRNSHVAVFVLYCVRFCLNSELTQMGRRNHAVVSGDFRPSAFLSSFLFSHAHDARNYRGERDRTHGDSHIKLPKLNRDIVSNVHWILNVSTRTHARWTTVNNGVRLAASCRAAIRQTKLKRRNQCKPLVGRFDRIAFESSGSRAWPDVHPIWEEKSLHSLCIVF